MIKEVLKLLEQGNVFLTGGAGSGKTTLTLNIIEFYKKSGKRSAALASTGMAATLLSGQTLHSFFDFGISNNQVELERFGKLIPSKKVINIIESMDLIIIDEISMVSAALLDMVRLRLLQVNFKGSLLVVGDFLQLPPVVKGSSSIVFSFESESWKRFNFYPFVLQGSYRTHEENFLTLLNAVRYGELTEENTSQLDNMIILNSNHQEMTWLFGKNNSAQKYNKERLNQLNGDLIEIKTDITVHHTHIIDKDIERFLQESRIESFLYLKLGAPILFTRNSWNYYNGEKGYILSIDEEAIWVKKENGLSVKVERVSTTKSRWNEHSGVLVEELLMTLTHFPLVLAFAITIHKSQGMSLVDYCIESNEIFAPSQFYVALSRAVSSSRVWLGVSNRAWKQLCFVDSKARSFVHMLEKITDKKADTSF